MDIHSCLSISSYGKYRPFYGHGCVFMLFPSPVMEGTLQGWYGYWVCILAFLFKLWTVCSLASSSFFFLSFFSFSRYPAPMHESTDTSCGMSMHCFLVLQRHHTHRLCWKYRYVVICMSMHPIAFPVLVIHSLLPRNK